ncbi:hypothetical protein RG959_00760 [Domibacillus sp. 8LH]|uniref:hypothetical protein n=1 Tax=Domibacillus sp. 8LH TaxID=3073900 RepID=UPI00316E24B8
MTKEQLLKTFNHDQSLYHQKRTKLNRWKYEFQQLEKDIQLIMAFFEKRYEELTIPDELEADVIEKLENRKEGIRLSVKSASRLLKKWNPDKEVQDTALSFTTSEALADQILQNRKQERLSVEEGVSFNEATEEEKQVNENVQIALEEEVLINEVTDHEAQKEIREVKEAEKETESKEQNDVKIIENAIHSNQEVLTELNECIEQAEKRFLSFFEKAAAPVMDGLYSGKKFAADWSKQLEESNHEQYTDIFRWLTVYDDLMGEFKGFFTEYAIELYIPKIASAFNEEKQEPIGVIEDAELKDEQIKEVVRFGLVYGQEIYQQESFLIRPAQVIVVKNPQQYAPQSGEDQEQ